MKRAEHGPLDLNPLSGDAPGGDPISRGARALFAAGARERAPEQLRAALLARAATHGAAGRRRRRWTIALGIAAGVAAALGLRELWRVAPMPEEPLISAERAPAPDAPLPELPRPSLPVPALSPRPAKPRTPEASRAAPRRNRPAQAPPASSDESAAGLEPAPAAAPVSPAPAPADLSTQLGLLQRIQKALRSGEQRRALELLDTDPQLERGNFAAEARLMRIEALDGTGRRREAAALAREFARLYPHSPLTDRARRFEGAPER